VSSELVFTLTAPRHPIGGLTLRRGSRPLSQRRVPSDNSASRPTKTLTLSGSSDNLLQLFQYFDLPAPLLKKLKLTFARTTASFHEGKLFDANLSSLRGLRLPGVIADLAWGNMSNLKTFDLRRVPGDRVSVTQLLNFFKRAPLLRKIRLEGAFPNSSDAPPGRVGSLPHLKFLTIAAFSAHVALLNHILIPIGHRRAKRLAMNPQSPSTSSNSSKTSKVSPTSR